MKRRVLFTIAALVLAGSLFLVARGCQDSLKYEIYAVRSGSEPELLAQGVLEANGRNVQTKDRSAFGIQVEDKWIQLQSGYSVGAAIFPEKQLDGFGLWIRRDGAGFSWNWFTREAGLVYRKLKGNGRVEVSLIPNKEYQQIAAIKFLDDIALTGQFGWLPYWDTDQVVVKKGSVLRLSH